MKSLDEDSIAWLIEDYYMYYRMQHERIKALADREDPEVRRTLEWSLPLLEDMAAGKIKHITHPTQRKVVM